MKDATPWNGEGSPPACAVLPDVFGFPFMPSRADVESGAQSNNAVATVLARVAAHPECLVYLPTEHAERAVAFSIHRKCPSAFAMDPSIWPPNLTLCAEPRNLNALLRLSAAAHGVWVTDGCDWTLALTSGCSVMLAGIEPPSWVMAEADGVGVDVVRVQR